jgi:branched-chain amino acid transport system permease protein
MNNNVLVELIIGGITLGGVYGLVAMGFVVVFKATGILNFAQGYLMTLGVYFSYLAFDVWHLELVVGVLAVMGGMLVIGVVSYIVVIRNIVGKSLLTGALIAIALGFIIQAAILIGFGPATFPNVQVLPSGSFSLDGGVVSYVDVTIIVIFIVIAAALAAFFRYSSLGRNMRAATDDLVAAVGVGIRPGSVFLWTWSGALVLAGFAGFLYANYSPTISLEISGIGLLAFPAAVIGGIRSIPGAIVGGLVVGVTQELATGYLGVNWGDVFPYIGLLAILMLRPNGLLGRPEVVRV